MKEAEMLALDAELRQRQNAISIKAQRDILLAAAKEVLPYLDWKASKYPGGDAEDHAAKLRRAIALAEKP